MKYSIIYTADCVEGVDVDKYAPIGDFKKKEGDLERGDTYPHHRKWVALLDEEEFHEFICEANIYYNPYAEGSSLGSPGCGMSIVPAFIFDAEFRENFGDVIIAEVSANVTPVLGRKGTSKEWIEIRKAMSVYE